MTELQELVMHFWRLIASLEKDVADFLAEVAAKVDALQRAYGAQGAV